MQELNEYKFTFKARRLGAIGAMENFYNKRVIADTEENARIKLYDAYEHIMVIKVEKDDVFKAYQCKTNPRYFMSVCYNGGCLWDSKTLKDIAPNETENSKELHKK